MLSLLEPGLGQIYNGQAGKGIFILVLPLFLMPLLPICINSNKFLFALVIFVCLTTIYYIFSIADAVRTALKFKFVYNLKRYNKIIVYLGIIAIVFTANTVISGILKNNYMQAYKIPSKSNKPTLLPGDQILADRRDSAKEPKRGAFIVFEFPEDPEKDFVKRIVAIAGDTVEISDKVLQINNQVANEPYVIHSTQEIYPEKINPRDNFGPVIVPEGTCFVLGDNRDQSYDSRFWRFVKNSKIKGTVKTIYWSWDKKNMKIRWNRIGKIVQ